MKVRTLTIAALLLTGCFNAPRPADRYRALDPVIDRFAREHQLPGFAIGIAENGRVVYTHATGSMRLGEKAPITTRTLFHMASITKPFVATSIMQLVERGKIDLDAPLTKYLPYFRMADERYKAITISMMLHHTSGIPDVEDYEWDKPQYDDDALDRYARSLATWQLDFAPGERFSYSNTAYEVLGDVIAKVSGESFEDYVQQHILTPLRMKDSTLFITKADKKLLAWGHEMGKDGKPFPSSVYPYNRTHSPSSDLHSNVDDMLRWGMANLNRGTLDGARILRDATYDTMWTNGVPRGDGKVKAGISWFITDYNGHRVIAHSGEDTGFITQLVLLPEKKIAVVWMMNADYLPEAPRKELTHAALDVALAR